MRGKLSFIKGVAQQLHWLICYTESIVTLAHLISYTGSAVELAHQLLGSNVTLAQTMLLTLPGQQHSVREIMRTISNISFMIPDLRYMTDGIRTDGF